MRKYLAFFVVAVGLGACSKSPPPICKSTEAKVCIAYTGTGYSDSSLQTTLKTQCQALTGYTFTASGECQTTTLIGSCTRNPGRAFEQVEKYFTGASKTTAQIESDCLAEGGIFRY